MATLMGICFRLSLDERIHISISFSAAREQQVTIRDRLNTLLLRCNSYTNTGGCNFSQTFDLALMSHNAETIHPLYIFISVRLN
jgi:hypothetical protein